MLGTETLGVLLLHCAKHCLEIDGVQYYVAYSTALKIFGWSEISVVMQEKR